MSARSIYVRDQAAKCEWHANNIRDDETEVALRKLAARYIAEADEIESKESDALTSESSGEVRRRERNDPKTPTPP